MPAGKKVIVTETDISKWLAAHYGLSLEKIPMTRPLNMARPVYERLKKHMLSNQATNPQPESSLHQDLDSQSKNALF